MSGCRHWMGRLGLWGAVLFSLAAASCGRVSVGSPAGGATGDGTAGGGATGAGTAGSGTSGEGTSTAVDESSGAAGLDAGAGSSSGGSSCVGSIVFGKSPAVQAIDPQVTRAWRWQACGTLPAEVHDTAVQALFPPSGTAVAVLYADGAVLLEPTTTAGATTTLRAPGGAPVQAIAFSPDGTQLAEVNQGAVQVRRLTDGKLSALATSDACTGNSLRFSAEGDYVFAWDLEGLCVWQLSDGTLVNALTGSFSSAAMSNGRILTAEVTTPPTVRSWPLQGGVSSLVPLQLPDGTTFNDPSAQPSSAITISPRGDTLGAAATLQDATSGDKSPMFELWSADGTLRGSFANLWEGLTYSESGAFVFAGRTSIEVATNQALFTLKEELLGLVRTIDASGTLVAGIERGPGGSPAVQVLNASGDIAPRLMSTLPSTAIVNGLAVSPDGAQLAVANYFGATLFGIAPEFAASRALFEVGRESVMAVDFASQGQALVIGGDGWQVFSVADGTYLCSGIPTGVLAPPGCEFNSARISPLGNWISTGGDDQSLNVFSYPDCDSLGPTHSVSGDLTTQRCNVQSVFSTDQQLLVTSGPELYRTCDWSRVWPAQVSSGPPDLLQDVRFFPDEKSVLVSNCATANGNAKLAAQASVCDYSRVSITDGTVLQHLPSLRAPRAAISSEGDWIAAGGVLLHLPSGDVLNLEPQARISTFTPNGDLIAVLADNSITRYCRTP